MARPSADDGAGGPIASPRVLFATDRFPTVSETFVLDQILALEAAGADVRVLARTAETEVLHPEIVDHDLLRRSAHTSVVLPDAAPLNRLQRWQWLARLPLPRPRGLSRGRLLRATHAFSRLGGPFDITIAHFGPIAAKCADLRAWGLPLGRLLAFFHGYDLTKTIRQEGQQAYAALFQNADRLLAISEYGRRRLLELGAPDDRTLLFRLGISLARFDFVERSRAANEPIRLLAVNRMVEKKGMPIALEALARARRGGLDVELDLVGDGPELERLRGLAETLEPGPAVRFLGALPRDEVAALMRRAHALVAPSVTAADGDQEGIPVTIMEAMATGLPVLSTHHAGIPELVEHGRTGWLSDEHDADGMAGHLVELAASEAQWPTIGRRARQRVAELHDGRRSNAALVGLVEAVMAGRRQQ